MISLRDPMDVNADWSAFDADTTASDVEKIGPAVDCAKFLDEAASEVVGIPLCLHTHKVIVGDDTEELGASWKSSKHFGSGPGNVMKVPDRVGDPDGPQLACKRDQVIVVNPDEIVRLDQMRQGIGETPIDPQVARVISPRELGQANPIMHDGPERPVGEAVIVLLPIERR